jgi:hypothetical protein
VKFHASHVGSKLTVARGDRAPGEQRSGDVRRALIEAGERVAVCGQGKHEADPDPQAATGGYRDTATRLVLAASPETPLYVSDDIATLR